jgi:hypothetical protein
MTIPRPVGKVVDMVRELISQRRNRVNKDEVALGIHLRTNEELYRTLVSIITSRIAGRATVVEPNNPIDCKTLLARDGECRWFLNILEGAYKSPVQPPESDEQPA